MQAIISFLNEHVILGGLTIGLGIVFLTAVYQVIKSAVIKKLPNGVKEKILVRGKGKVFKIVNRIMKLGCLISAVAVVAVAAIFLIELHNAGWSLTIRDTVITVHNEHYDIGMDYTRMQYYNEAIQELLLARAELSDNTKKSILELAEVEQKIGYNYLELDRFDEAYEMLNSAYTYFNKKLGAKNNKTIIAKAQICLYYSQLGELERAEQGLSELYDDTKQAKYKLQIGQMLAQIYMQNEDYTRAYDMYVMLIQLHEGTQQILNELSKDSDEQQSIYSSSYLYLYNDLGLTCFYMGEYEKGIQFLDYAVAIRKQYSTSMEKDEALLYSNLAMIYAGWGKFEEVNNYNQKAFNMYRKIYGDHGLDMAIVYARIAQNYAILQMRETEYEYLFKGLELARAAVGEHHALMAALYSDVGLYYSYVGDNSKAMEYAKKAIEIRKEILGRYHTTTASLYVALAQICISANVYDEALDAADEAVEIYEHIFGTDNINTARAYCAAAWSYDALDYHSEALEFVKSAVSIVEKYGIHASNVDAGYAYETLAYILTDNDINFENVEYYFNTALEHYSASFTKEHTTIATVYYYFGNYYRDAEEYTKALSAYTKTENIYEKLHPNDFGFLENVYGSLGFVHHKLLNYAEALTYYEKSREIRQRRIDKEIGLPNINIGRQFHALAATYNNVAAVCEDMGEIEIAAENELAAYKILIENGFDILSERNVYDRLHRLYNALEPAINFEKWLDG